MDSIVEYNKQLINDNIKLNIIDYFKEVHYKFYKDINITFMEYFLEICNKDDKFIIEHSKLKNIKSLHQEDQMT